MGLWIRSQNKSYLYQLNMFYIKGADIYGFDSSCDSDDDAGYLLGEYKTYERALEVLDDIQQCLVLGSALSKFRTNISEIPDDKDAFKNVINNILGFAEVYQMPKE